MPDKLTSAQLEELSRDGADVQRTLYDFGEAKIELSTKGDLSIIRVTGCYSPELTREIQSRARPLRGNIGLVFEDVEWNPRTRGRGMFDGRILGLLRSLRERCERKGFSFFLCSPPSELRDVLNLAGVLEDFDVVDDLAVAPRQRKPAGRMGEATDPQEAGERRSAGKKIYVLNQSLRRTDSLEKELDSAAACIQKFLPQSPPSAQGFEFAFFYRSCEKVGGDFFDFVPIDERNLGLAIGDVSGHGLDAAIVMGITKKLIHLRALETESTSPSAVLARVNEDLWGDLDRRTFVTALYGTLDMVTGIFRFARAGHELPVAFRPGVGARAVPAKGPALGVASPRVFSRAIEDAAVRLRPGFCLFLITDGLAECRNAKGGLYSRDRILFDLGHLESGKSAQKLLDEQVGKIVAFAAGGRQEDDMTAILIQRTKP